MYEQFVGKYEDLSSEIFSEISSSVCNNVQNIPQLDGNISILSDIGSDDIEVTENLNIEVIINNRLPSQRNERQ